MQLTRDKVPDDLARPRCDADASSASIASESDDRLRDFVELAADWFWETDSDLRYKYLSEQYREATGLSPESRLGYRRGDFRLRGPEDGDWDAHFADLNARRPFRDFKFAYLDVAGRRRIAVMSGRPVFDTAGRFTGYRGVGRDVTAESNVQKQLMYLVRHDSLTGLCNRSMLQERLEQTLAAARRGGTGAAILSIDLDDFKVVNDTFGHAAGDTLLCEAARRMKATVREIDTVARVGGDEFIIVQAESNGFEPARILAGRLIDRLAEPVGIGGETVRCGASIGISLYPDNGQDIEDLQSHADLALYKAKGNGPNQFRFFTPDMNEQVQERRAVERLLSRAVEDESLFLEYQPQIEIGSGRAVGLEALVRWTHPGHGVVPPAMFVDVAERCGLILSIDRWVLRKACARAKAWSDAGVLPGRVAINLSATLLAQPGVVDTIRAILDETGLAPERLEIEISENVMLIDTDTVSTTMRTLSEMGISLAVDDFGTGYSSLTYLRRFPVDKVKIDRSFVGNVGHDQNDAAVARAIISLGHSLGLVVTAEGVEHRQQLDFLRDAGCDLVQGYLLARPLGAEQCERYLAKRL